MYSSFSKKELDNSIKDINNIIVKTLPENDVNYDKLRVKSIQFFKKIYEMNKDNNLKTKLLFIPQ
jgi:hypothetical protein